MTPEERVRRRQLIADAALRHLIERSVPDDDASEDAVLREIEELDSTDGIVWDVADDA
jgi:hypothetical protein